MDFNDLTPSVKALVHKATVAFDVKAQDLLDVSRPYKGLPARLRCARWWVWVQVKNLKDAHGNVWTYPRTAKALGVDHTSVMYACKHYAETVLKNPAIFNLAYQRLRAAHRVAIYDAAPDQQQPPLESDYDVVR